MKKITKKEKMNLVEHWQVECSRTGKCGYCTHVPYCNRVLTGVLDQIDVGELDLKGILID